MMSSFVSLFRSFSFTRLCVTKGNNEVVPLDKVTISRRDKDSLPLTFMLGMTFKMKETKEDWANN